MQIVAIVVSLALTLGAIAMLVPAVRHMLGVIRSGARWLTMLSLGWAIARLRRARPRSRAQMSINCAGVAGHVIDTGREPRMAAGIIVASTISAIGVMPAMGSVENWPSEYETAPTRRPSM